MKYNHKKKDAKHDLAIEKLVLMLSHQKSNPLTKDPIIWNYIKVGRVVGLRVGTVKGIVTRFKRYEDPGLDVLQRKKLILMERYKIRKEVIKSE